MTESSYWKPEDSVVQDFLAKMFRRAHSEHSRRYYRFGINNFVSFCNETKVRSVSQKRIYEILDSYVSWLDKKGTKPKTIADYMSAIRKFLGYIGIEIEVGKFKNKVTMPRVIKIQDEPLTIEVARKILSSGRPNPRMSGLILLLLSSGLRLGEALSIKVNDIDLKGSPASVKVKAEYTKTRQARVAYMSDEARDAISKIIERASKERLVFDYSGDLWVREKVANRTFRDVVKRAGLGEKIEDHRIHKIHFHNFRKFFLTKGSDIIGEHAAHALCGHGFYMDTYYKKSEKERQDDYLKLMPYLTVWKDRGISAAEQKVELNKHILRVAKYSEQEIDALNVAKLTDEEVGELARQRLSKQIEATTATTTAELDETSKNKSSLNENRPKEEAVRIADVDRYLADGYHASMNLGDGRVIMQPPGTWR